MKTKSGKPALKVINQLSPDAQNYSYGSYGCGCVSCGCGCGSCGCGMGGGTGPDDCMPQDVFWKLRDQGALKSSVYVCGLGWTSPGITVYGSCGSCGYGSCGSCGCGSCGSCGSCGCGSCGSCGYGSCGSCGSLFNIDAAVNYLISHAKSSSTGNCAKAVRLALEAGGFSTGGRPTSACDYDTYLANRGFHKVSNSNYIPRKGDIVVHEATVGHPHGHVAMYSGTQWISDFVQRDMFGGQAYREAKNYTIWRS